MSSGKYDDIIHMPHHVSRKHPQMPVSDRAAQFSPFAALTGHGDAIKETERLTQQRIELDENDKLRINEKLQLLQENIRQQPEIRITYFQPDLRKEGGAYVEETGCVKKIDSYGGKLVLENGIVISIEEIYDIQSSLFCRISDE